MIGRRRSDVAAARAGVPTRHVLRGRLGAVSVTGAMTAGAWVGFGLGLVLGAVIGALLCWFAGAALDWQRNLGFTLGVAQSLLPLGDQTPTLEAISGLWYLVIPAVAIVWAALWAVIAALVAGLVAATYNRVSRHALVLVELSEPELVALEESMDQVRAAGLALERPGQAAEVTSGDGETVPERRLSVVVTTPPDGAEPPPNDAESKGAAADPPGPAGKPSNGKRRRAS